MIASFFSKTKPIHLVIISLVLLMAFVLSKIMLANIPFDIYNIGKQSFIFGICLFTVFVFDFVTGKNNLTKKNSYRVLFFTLFMIMFPQTFLDTKLIMANLFVILALRRVVSLRTQKDLKKKLYDAALWISVATLFYFWAGLFFILIFSGLFLFRITEVKNWAIPFLGLVTVIILTCSYLILINENILDYFLGLDYIVSFDFSTLNSNQVIISSTIITSYFIWSMFYYLRNIKNKSKSFKPSYFLVLIATLIGALIIVISPNKTGSEFIFLFAPLSIVLTNYIEIIEEKWFREVLVWVLILTPFLGLVL